MNTWKREYDETLQQYYYINTEDNLISYDLPCEVKTPTSKHGLCKTESPMRRSLSMFTKLGTVLRKSSRQDSHLSQNTLVDAPPKDSDVRSIISGLDEYILQPSFNLNPTKLGELSDAESVSSDDLIHSYYSDYARDAAYPYYYEEETHTESYERQQERLELRAQFLKELEIE